MSLAHKLAPKLEIPHPFSAIVGNADLWAVSVSGPDGGPARKAKIVTLGGWTVRIAPTSKKDLRELSRPREPRPEEDEDAEP